MDDNKLKIISSQGIDQWNEYGKDLFQSYKKYWPKSLPLNLYTESFENFPTEKQLKKINLIETGGSEYNNFINDKTIWRRTKKFAHKAFAIIHALENTSSGFLIWIDADVVTKKDISIEWLLSICPDDCLTAHLGLNQYNKKLDKTVYGAETGFFVINCNHPDRQKFINEYKRSYIEKDFEGLRKPFDAEVFARTIKKIDSNYRELSPDLNLLGPFRKSILAEYMYHYKAKHKKKLSV